MNQKPENQNLVAQTKRSGHCVPLYLNKIIRWWWCLSIRQVAEEMNGNAGDCVTETRWTCIITVPLLCAFVSRYQSNDLTPRSSSSRWILYSYCPINAFSKMGFLPVPSFPVLSLPSRPLLFSPFRSWHYRGSGVLPLKISRKLRAIWCILEAFRRNLFSCHTRAWFVIIAICYRPNLIQCSNQCPDHTMNWPPAKSHIKS